MNYCPINIKNTFEQIIYLYYCKILISNYYVCVCVLSHSVVFYSFTYMNHFIYFAAGILYLLTSLT